MVWRCVRAVGDRRGVRSERASDRGAGARHGERSLFNLTPTNSLSLFSPAPPQLTPLFADDGTYADWDQLDSLWEHALM